MSLEQKPEEKPSLRRYNAQALLSSEELWKILCVAYSGDGKTYFGLSILWYLTETLKLPLEKIQLCYVDLDGGLALLLKQFVNKGRITPEQIARIEYFPCRSFDEILEATEQSYQLLAEHKKKFGAEGGWIIVDNMEKAWEWAQQMFSEVAYGQDITQRMMEARKSQILAKKKGPNTKGQPVFNQELDYGVINPIHNNWSGSFPLCGFNYIWLSPYKIDEDTGEARYGQKQNKQKIDYAVNKFRNPPNSDNILGDVIKSRSTEKLPKQIRDLDVTSLISAIKAQEEKERKKVDSPKVVVNPGASSGW